MTANDPDRVEFEAKLMFLERTLEVLQETVQDQAGMLDELRGRVATLETALESADQPEIRPHDDRPPHY